MMSKSKGRLEIALASVALVVVVTLMAVNTAGLVHTKHRLDALESGARGDRWTATDQSNFINQLATNNLTLKLK